MEPRADASHRNRLRRPRRLRGGRVEGTRTPSGSSKLALPDGALAYCGSAVGWLDRAAVFHIRGTTVAEIRFPVGSGVFDVTPNALWSWDPIAQRIVGLPRSPIRLPGSGL